MRQAPSELADDDDDDVYDDDQAGKSEPPRNLGFKIEMRQHVTADNKPGEGAVSIKIYIRWIWGLDSALFESFYGMLRKNISTANN